MNTVTICVSFIVTIFGIAYPILFQVVSRLDEKYSSILILELFNKEKERNYFIGFLISSLVLIFIYILKLPPLSNFNKYFIIRNSAIILLGTSTVFLIISFFYFVKKILIYYTPTRFLKYLIKRHNEQEDKDYTYFKAISDILYFSVKEQNENVAKTISDFMYSAFKKQREVYKEGTIKYPASFYEVIYKSTEELANLKSKKLTFLEYRTVGGIWLLGESGNFTISEVTFSCLWRNLLLAIRYERDDMIMNYWSNAHQYFSYQLQKIAPKYLNSPFNPTKIINKKEIENRNAERERFIEFHYALGGLLLYKKRYSCVGRIFRYTTSIPPKYELLPETMGEIFKMYIEFRDPYEDKYTWISHTYPFPDLEGLNADYVIKKWITEYIGVLFVRQYSIQPYLITMKPLELPTIPKTQAKKKVWINNIDYFKTIAENILSNEKLLSETRLDFITDSWLEEEKKPTPQELIDLYKSQIESDYEKTEIEQEVSKIKKEEFETSSNQIIEKTVNFYAPINNQNKIENNFNNWFIYGERAVIDKSAFTDDQDSQHLNFDSFLADHIANKFQQGISETFFYTKSNSYLLKEKDIFPAIDKLNPHCVLF